MFVCVCVLVRPCPCLSKCLNDEMTMRAACRLPAQVSACTHARSHPCRRYIKFAQRTHVRASRPDRSLHVHADSAQMQHQGGVESRDHVPVRPDCYGMCVHAYVCLRVCRRCCTERSTRCRLCSPFFVCVCVCVCVRACVRVCAFMQT